jgi:hypothetical protein
LSATRWIITQETILLPDVHGRTAAASPRKQAQNTGGTQDGGTSAGSSDTTVCGGTW